MGQNLMTTPSKLYWLAPAKINLFLHITGRRPDGYHDLQTVFQLIDYYDELIFERRSDKQLVFHCSASKEALGDPQTYRALDSPDNLVSRVASFLQIHYRPHWGANIFLKKRIPVGGGLGGGSSDAAAALLALTQLWKLPLSSNELDTIAQRFGADVPVFVRGRTMWGEGIGEQLSPVPCLNDWFVVISPPVVISTQKIFSELKLVPWTPTITKEAFIEGRITTRNDCELTVRRLYPLVAEALDRLSSFLPARLTGTGACIFAFTKDRTQALTILRKMPSYLPGFVSRGIGCSPMGQLLNEGEELTG